MDLNLLLGIRKLEAENIIQRSGIRYSREEVEYPEEPGDQRADWLPWVMGHTAEDK